MTACGSFGVMIKFKEISQFQMGFSSFVIRMLHGWYHEHLKLSTNREVVLTDVYPLLYVYTIGAEEIVTPVNNNVLEIKNAFKLNGVQEQDINAFHVDQ